ncbi:MAG: hypothetical protein AAF718_08890 [Pseudomonadota bacterium]
MSALPPIWRYWPVYLVVISIACGLIFVWDSHVKVLSPKEAPNAMVLFAGVAVAALAIIANTWSQWQTSRISHALEGLQTLRTDREYLINSNVVTLAITLADDSEWGQPLGPSLAREFGRKLVGSKIDEPSFYQAALFLLNQYEFLAAATRSGAIDFVLMKETMGGPIENLVTTFSEQITEIRKDRPKAFKDLIWLHRTFSGSLQPYLGPIA